MKKGMLGRGYSSLNKQMENKGKFIADCRSCDYMYPPTEGAIEQCNNKGVTKFDMAERENGQEYCTYWVSAGRSRRGNDL